MSMLQDLAAAGAMAAGLAVSPAFSLEPLNDSELADVRGGYLSAGGFTFDFGVLVQTWVDGTLALESTLSLNSHGAVGSVKPGDVSNVTPLADAAISGLDLQGIHGEGFALSGNGGTTVLIQDVSQTSIRNLIVNTAQDRTIVQNTALTVVMPNLPELQQGMSLEHIRTSLDQALNSGLLGSASH